jgi:Fic family protein
MASSGYTASLDNAVDVVNERLPDGMFEVDRLAIESYSRALAWIDSKGADDDFVWRREAIKDLHFLLSGYSGQRPGLFRGEPDDDSRDGNYVPPRAADVPRLIDELCGLLNARVPELDPLLRALVAHINILAIRPFHDGNVRLARAVSWLVLRKAGFPKPEYFAIDDYSARFSHGYWTAVNQVRGDSFNSDAATMPFVQWALRAYRWQTERVISRAADLADRWARCSGLVTERNLPRRVAPALFNASVGVRISNQTYRVVAPVSPPTAVSDLRALVQAQLLENRGSGRETHYVATTELLAALNVRSSDSAALLQDRTRVSGARMRSASSLRIGAR